MHHITRYPYACQPRTHLDSRDVSSLAASPAIAAAIAPSGGPWLGPAPWPRHLPPPQGQSPSRSMVIGPAWRPAASSSLPLSPLSRHGLRACGSLTCVARGRIRMRTSMHKVRLCIRASSRGVTHAATTSFLKTALYVLYTVHMRKHTYANIPMYNCRYRCMTYELWRIVHARHNHH